MPFRPQGSFAFAPPRPPLGPSRHRTSGGGTAAGGRSAGGGAATYRAGMGKPVVNTKPGGTWDSDGDEDGVEALFGALARSDPVTSPLHRPLSPRQRAAARQLGAASAAAAAARRRSGADSHHVSAAAAAAPPGEGRFAMAAVPPASAFRGFDLLQHHPQHHPQYPPQRQLQPHRYDDAAGGPSGLNTPSTADVDLEPAGAGLRPGTAGNSSPGGSAWPILAPAFLPVATQFAQSAHPGQLAAPGQFAGNFGHFAPLAGPSPWNPDVLASGVRQASPSSAVMRHDEYSHIGALLVLANGSVLRPC